MKSPTIPLYRSSGLWHDHVLGPQTSQCCFPNTQCDFDNAVLGCAPILIRERQHNFTKTHRGSGSHAHALQWNECTNVRRYTCTNIRMYGCTNVRMYKYTNAGRYECTNVRMHECTNVDFEFEIFQVCVRSVI